METHYRIVDGLESVQRSEEWCNFRKGKIGASDVPAIMGVSPFETALKLWERMIFDKKISLTSAMLNGIDREDEALEWFNKRDKSPPLKPMVIQSKKYPWMIASLDGAEGIGEKIYRMLEIKWPNRQVHDFVKEMGCPPTRYQHQLQFQMYIADLPFMYYLSCHGEEKIVVRVNRDDSMIKEMIARVIAFRDCLVNFRAPEATDRDKVVIDDPDLAVMAERFMELDRLITELSNERDDIRGKLIGCANHPRSIIGPLSLTKVIRPGSIMYADIPELKGVDLLQYRKKPIESWRLSYE